MDFNPILLITAHLSEYNREWISSLPISTLVPNELTEAVAGIPQEQVCKVLKITDLLFLKSFDGAT